MDDTLREPGESQEETKPSQQFNPKVSLALLLVALLVPIAHVVNTGWQCSQINREMGMIGRMARETGQAQESSIPTIAGISFPRPLARGVRVRATPDREFSLVFIDSDYPPVRPSDVAFQYNLSLILSAICLIGYSGTRKAGRVTSGCFLLGLMIIAEYSVVFLVLA